MKRFEITGTVRVSMSKDFTKVIEAEDKDTAIEEFQSAVEDAVGDGSLSFVDEDPEDLRVLSPTVVRVLKD